MPITSILSLAVLLGAPPVEVRGSQQQLLAAVHTTGQSPYVYPLLGPGGTPMTRGYPMDPQPGEATDHPHHRSLWLAHGDVNGFDFWHPAARSGTIETRDIAVTRDAATTRVALELAWVADGTTLLAETRTLTFGTDATDDERWVDVKTVLRAVETVTFGDTKEGFFALRLHPALRLKGDVATGSIENSNGERDGAAWGQRARWVAYRGMIDEQAVGVQVMEHPSNAREPGGDPTWWHARDYGLVAANPFGAHDFSGAPEGTGALTLQSDETLTLVYRVRLFTGARETADLHAAWQSWSTR